MNATPPRRPGSPPATQLPVELTDEVAQGTYSNLMFVTHSLSEFILDFARALPGARKGRVYSRIVMTPQHAKALSELLNRNVAAYESNHGPISTGTNAEGQTIGFTTPDAKDGDKEETQP